ncbi:MAG: J domain-containing protein [Hyphomicrobiaceae bacterium]|nr:J domain-containing protein [Hyphomicrobiaceae bacterium]
MASNLFDSIRVKPRQKPEDKPKGPICEWEGCEKPAEHRAPKGRGAEGQFFHFCTEHVREYNRTFNYFAEMNDSEIGDELKRNAQTGGRPTWQQSTNGSARTRSAPRTARSRKFDDTRFNDPLNLFARASRTHRHKPMTERELRMVEVDRRAFESLGFENRATPEEIRKRYKELVKKHHPDANGGDKASEERLRSIITAYNHLKSKGFLG